MATFLGAISGSKDLMNLTSNQYYKGLNNRYDNRYNKLRKLGFKLDRERMLWHIQRITQSDVNNGRLMSNEFVYHADKRSFEDRVKQVRRK